MPEETDCAGGPGRRLYRAFFFAVVGFWTLVVFPSSLVVTILTGSHRIGHRLHARLWGRAILATAGVRLVVHGLERLSPAAPFVFLVNHGSLVSGFAAAAALRHQWRAVLDSWIRRIPVFGWIGILAGHVFLDRSRTPRAIESLNRAGERIRGGISVLVFPEGEFNDEGKLLPFRKGSFHLALRAGVPLVVLTAVETIGTPSSRTRRVDLYVSEPIETKGREETEIPSLMAEARAEMLRHATGGVFRIRD